MSIKDNFKNFVNSVESFYDSDLRLCDKMNRYILRIFFDDLGDSEIDSALYGLGSNDGGVDAYFINDNDGKIYLCQIKTVETYSAIEGNINYEKDIGYLCDFVDKMNDNAWLQGKSKMVQENVNEIKSLIADKGYEIKFVFFALNSAIKEGMRNFAKIKNVDLYDWSAIYTKHEDFMQRTSDADYPDGEIHLVASDKTKFQQFKTSDARYSWIGIVKASSLIKMYQSFGFKLFDKNVRYSLGGKNKINDGMQKTIKGDPKAFYYFNNGITITCTTSKARKDDTELNIVNPSVINGAQTVNTIVNTLKIDNRNQDDINVLCRVINRVDNLQGQAFIHALTRYNNSHTPVKEVDFLSKRPEQKALYQKFKEREVFFMNTSVVFGII